LISDNWGGTPVQAWSSPDALKKCATSDELAVISRDELGGPNDPSNLWNAMIIPILNMTIKGATWYQGESNTGQQNYYACEFPAMISDWRLKWGGDTDKTFGFYFVQLAPWLGGDNNGEALIRLSQIYATLLPKVGVATAIDAGDPTSPLGDIHPRFKQIVGQRLSLAARGITYMEKIQYKGPQATGFKVLSDSPSAVVQVDFETDSIGGGLVIQMKECQTGVPVNQCGWVDLGTSDGRWTNATATISGNSLLVKGTTTSTVTGVRYAWANYPVAFLWNKDGLPALPFAFPNPIKPVTIYQ